MGKDLKGKELGRGIVQRKDKKYYARFTAKNGNRNEFLSEDLREARRWLEKAKYEDKYCSVSAESKMTLDTWFDYWVKNIVSNRAYNTTRNYNESYNRNIKPVIGNLPLSQIKQYHCVQVLNRMKENGYAVSTIYQVHTTLGALLRSAVENEFITKNPMNGIKPEKTSKSLTKTKCFTEEEQRRFLAVAKDTHNYRPYALILETGLRIGELIALTWDLIDLENKTLTIRKTMEYRYSTKQWRAGPPKTVKSYRTIPLTQKAVEILEEERKNAETRKISDSLNKSLSFYDKRIDEEVSFNMQDLVFLNFRTGMPTKNSTYDSFMSRLCDKAQIPQISVHGLRHTFATRAIERGVSPKILQKLLGHSSITVTMDRYVHVTDDSLFDGIKQFERGM